MKILRKIFVAMIALLMTVQLIDVAALTNTKALENIKINASNYNQYREQLELDANKDVAINRTTSKTYKFGTYATTQVDGWNVKILSTEVGSDGYHTIKFEAEEGYKLPATKASGDTRFAKVSVSNMSGQSYTLVDNIGVLKFKPVTSKFNTISNNVAPNVVYTHLVGIPEDVEEKDYLTDYVFVEVQHQGIDFNLTQHHTGIDPIVNGSRTYLIKKDEPFKVYYMNQEHMKPVETQPSQTGVSFDHDDYKNRYCVIDGSRTDTTNKVLAYDTTIFNVFVYSYTKGGWVRLNSYDFYHQDNTVTMPDINNENITFPQMRVVSFSVQELIYKPHMANDPTWNTKTVGLDYSFSTKANDYNVQWTSTGVDGGNDQYRESSLRHRFGDIYITPGYQYEYVVRFIDHDGHVLDTQKVLSGQDALAPTDPSRTGYTFEGWDKEFTNIQSHLDVNATYKIIEDELPVIPEVDQYKVTFVDYDGTVLKEQLVDKGNDASSPTSPSQSGYKFVGWDKEFTNIQGDLIVNAVYEKLDIEITVPVVPEGPTTPTPPENTVVPNTPTITTPPENTEVPIVPNTPTVTTPVDRVVNTPIVDNGINNDQVIDDNDTPLANGDTTINDNQTPLAKSIGGAWALVNLICTVLTILIGFILLFAKHKKEEDNEDKDEKDQFERRRWTKGFAIFVGIVSVVIFILTEDMTLPMQWVDKWTLTMLIVLLVQVATFFIGRQWKDKQDDKEMTKA